MDVYEIKEKLINDYWVYFKNKHHYEINDNEVDREACCNKMEYIVEMLEFITDWSKSAVFESLNSQMNYIIELNPTDDKLNWDLCKFDWVEVQKDIYYGTLPIIIEEWETSEYQLQKEGFKIESNGKEIWIIIPIGSLMRFNGANKNGWPTFTLRMKYTDYDLTFTGDSLKLKLI